MPQESSAKAPDSSAVRTALWRALHVEIDAPPHVLEDVVGLQLANPDDGWRQRPDMDPDATLGFRAAIVARARFVEDLVAERSEAGVQQYVILGSGLDTFVQRNPSAGSHLRVFEIDEPATQAWKRERLVELGHGIPDWLRFVPVDFEAGVSWRDQLFEQRFQSCETGDRRFHRGLHVSHSGRGCLDAGPGGDPGTRIDGGHVIPLTVGVARHSRGAIGAWSRTRSAGRGNTLDELLHPGADARDGRRGGFGGRSTCSRFRAGRALFLGPNRRPPAGPRRGPSLGHNRLSDLPRANAGQAAEP
jgi:hypothetical protein